MLQIIISCLMLLSACMDRDKPIDKSKLSGSDYRLFQNTPAWDIAKAVQDEDVSKIDKIVKENPELIDFQDPKYGSTLLMLTIMNQQIKSFKELLERKANVNIHDTYDGSSALIEACSFQDYDIEYAQLLIKYGANVNDIEVGERRQGNSTRATPLISAAQSRKIEFVELLLKNGADINYKNEFDQTALSESIMLTYYNISFFLLQYGADYIQPIFYRPDYSVPSELRDPNDKGKPMYLVDVLRESFEDFVTEEYLYKMKIVEFLKDKGIDYRAAPIPDFIKERIQKEYPNNWQEFLEKY